MNFEIYSYLFLDIIMAVMTIIIHLHFIALTQMINCQLFKLFILKNVARVDLIANIFDYDFY